MTEPVPSWNDVYSDFSKLGQKEFINAHYLHPEGPPEWVIDKLGDRPTKLTTEFFRSDDFERFATEVAPGLHESLGRPLRIGQVACGDGEETWTVAALLEKAGVGFTIAGFDINKGSLSGADRAVYPKFDERQQEKAEELGVTHLFEQTDRSHIQPVAALRDRATFAHYDARNQLLPGGPYDVLIVKNLLFHYANPVRDRMLANMLAGLDAEHGVMLFDPPVAYVAEPTFIPWRKGLAHRFGLTEHDADGGISDIVRRYRPKPYTTPAQATLGEHAAFAPDGNTVANIGACVLDAVNSIPLPALEIARDRLLDAGGILEDTIGYGHLRDQFGVLGEAHDRLKAAEDLLYKAVNDFDGYLASIGYDGTRTPHEQPS